MTLRWAIAFVVGASTIWPPNIFHQTLIAPSGTARVSLTAVAMNGNRPKYVNAASISLHGGGKIDVGIPTFTQPINYRVILTFRGVGGQPVSSVEVKKPGIRQPNAGAPQLQ